jgi:hypothetical protein
MARKEQDMKTLLCRKGHNLIVSESDFLNCGSNIIYMRCTLCGSAIVGALPILMDEEPLSDPPRRRDDELMSGSFTSDNEIFSTPSTPEPEPFKSGGGGDFGGGGASGSWGSDSSSSDSNSSDSSSSDSSSSDSSPSE